MLTFTIPGDPKPKKNSQQLIRAKGRTIPIQSKNYRMFEAGCKDSIPKLDAPIGCPVNVKMVFFRDTKRRVDLVNLEESICDILVKYGVLQDDCRDIVASMDGSRVYHDKVNPRTVITITELEERYEQWKTI